MPNSSKPTPRVVICAGPNGAGKSTHADVILVALGIETFVNADYIARGLSGRNTDAVALPRRDLLLFAGKRTARHSARQAACGSGWAQRAARRDTVALSSQPEQLLQSLCAAGQ